MRKCESCGRTFVPKSEAQKTCSDECQRLYHRIYMRNYMRSRRDDTLPQRAAVKCRYCGREFVPGNGRTKFCSETCAEAKAKSRYLQQLAESRRLNAEKQVHVCVMCGKEFKSQRSTKKYCSMKCQHLMNRNKAKERWKLLSEEQKKIINRRGKETHSRHEATECMLGISRSSLDDIWNAVIGEKK